MPGNSILKGSPLLLSHLMGGKSSPFQLLQISGQIVHSPLSPSPSPFSVSGQLGGGRLRFHLLHVQLSLSLPIPPSYTPHTHTQKKKSLLFVCHTSKNFSLFINFCVGRGGGGHDQGISRKDRFYSISSFLTPETLQTLSRQLSGVSLDVAAAAAAAAVAAAAAARDGFSHTHPEISLSSSSSSSSSTSLVPNTARGEGGKLSFLPEKTRTEGMESILSRSH